MLLRRLATLSFALVLLAPAAAAQGRAGGPAGSPADLPPRAKEAFEALPPDVQRALIDECGETLRCYRDAMRRYRQQASRDADRESPVGVVGAPRPGDRIRPVGGQPDEDAAGSPRLSAGSQPHGGSIGFAPPAVEVPFAMPPRLAQAFAALPPDVQAEMVERCDDTLDCYRRAMRRYREQQGGAAAAPPADPSDAVGPGQGGGGRATAGGTVGGGGFEPGADPTPGPRDSRPGRPDLSPVPDEGGRHAPGTFERPAPDLPGPVGTDDDDEPVARPNSDEPSASPNPTGLYYDGDALSETATSGHSGTSLPETRRPGNGAVLLGMYVQEESDVPCAFLFFWYRNNDADVRQGHFSTEASRCGAVAWTDPSGRLLPGVEVASITYIPDAEIGDIRAVNAVEACVNRDDDRIKGIRLSGAHIDEDGRVTSDSSLSGEEFERTNCHDWRPERTCPSGEVAVGVELDFTPSSDLLGGTADGASGMRLICADPYTE
ncbi:hypothetical protein [Rubrivirga sp. IMCC45206]|uniref:hypothetical protein n=1 Tax=Rubrivirga sp. IMCC45206 TaxID=3391614 RepID=UPI00398FCC72